MQVVDTLVLDPVNFLPNGAELDLTAAGFQVLDADFGEADVELEMQRQAIGEVPTSYHPPNTVTTLKLSVRKEGEVDLPTAAHQLAQKVGEINTPGTEHWLRRDFDYKAEGEFAGSLGKRVYKATLSGLGGWQRGDSPDVTLTLVTGSYWYATVEQESGVFESAEGARELVFELAEVLGTSPGLIRIRISNDGEEDWRGLILAGECLDHPQDETADTTAALSYAAADLTLKGGSEVKEVEGLEVVENENLAAGWLSILNSEITAEELGHMTHRRVRRLWVRAEDPDDDPDNVQLKVWWRVLGSTQWSENRIVPLNIAGDYQLYDLGECRPEGAVLGDQRWEFEVQARAVSGTGKVRLHRVAPLPTEQYMVLKAPQISQAADQLSSKLPGKVESTGEGVAWLNPENAKASDDSRATSSLSGSALLSKALVATTFGFSIPGSATITGVVAEIEKSVSNDAGVIDNFVRLVKGGSIVGASRGTNAAWPTSDTRVAYGGSGDLFDLALAPADVNSSGFGVAISARALSNPEVSARVDRIRLIVYFTELADENRICFASRSVELRSDGVFRQHPSDDVWGELIPEGFLPFATPSGLEGRKSRFVVIPSQGDLGDLADSGENSMGTQSFVRPGYLYAREAA